MPKTQFKRQALDKKLESNKLSAFEASATGSDFKWLKILTVCILDLSKENAVELIKWSDYDFGVWCDVGRIPTLLYVEE